ncbi:MAG: pknB 32 [Planctomycetaceae bacterium]|nr:pknB 32 [Planctomycetaceae bacterium]
MPVSREKQIFLSALDLGTDADRQAYLAEACSDDHALRESVDELLAAHGQQTNLLDQPLEPCANLRQQVDDEMTAQKREAPQVGSELSGEGAGESAGNYRLLEQIGEGGFGQVFVAQQQHPVRRQVAVKVLKHWDDSGEILARFEAERQALAMMDHPHIARVFDAGTTADGHPFFVMELVRGVSITDFCEQQQLSIPQRLELFINVCQAVQHAHQKGVIHRDLKPSNVMVALHDATPVAKVIDFGVAKAISQVISEPLTDKTIYTRFSQMIGTPMYMSPEQAEMNSLDVDTRSDVYSLGMVLYELLTGTSPYDKKRLRTANYDELRRIIREEELPSPSSRLSTLAASLSTVSANRRVTSPQLTALIRGDLDWIVMKAVEKARARRYESASALATDIRRHLDNQPIEARPPSRWYRFTKFALRHKVTITAASLVSLAMIIGTGFSLWQASRAVAERDDKERARQDAVKARGELEGFVGRLKEANVLLASGRAHADAGRWPAASADYKRATDLLPNYYHVWVERGALHVRLGLWQAAAEDYANALKLQAPVSGAEWWGVPQLLLFAKNDAAFRTTSLGMLGQKSDPSETPSASAIRSCVFATQPIVDPQQLAKWAEQSLASNKDSHGGDRPGFGPPPGVFGRTHGPGGLGGTGHFKEGPREPPPDGRRGGPGPGPGPGPGHGHGFGTHGHPPPGGPGGPRDRGPFTMSLPRGAVLYVAGLAHYRAGNYDRALVRLGESLSEDRGWPGRSICYPVQAMAYHRTGKKAEAREALETTKQTIDDWLTSMLDSPVGETPVPWFDWIECQLLYREASALITGSAPPDDPRLKTIEDRARSASR